MKAKFLLPIAFSLAAMLTVVGCTPQGGTQYHFPHAESAYLPTDEGKIEENLLDDDYETYYQIFVYSFCDGDEDGRGDIAGITSKLDYIRKMGYTGIWLTPITEGGSNHAYDVIDYYEVDDRFGTLDDVKALVKKAHSLGIKVILDMVFNHTSDRNEWFSDCVMAHIDGDTSNKYYNYYDLRTSAAWGGNSQAISGTYQGKSYSYYYESSQGQHDMPDLNLDNAAVQSEIANIIKFWMQYGIDGFRLDAVKNYFSSLTKSAQFVGWIATEAKKYNQNAYIVGEVYGGESEIKTFYNNGSPAQSYFWFPDAYFPEWSWPSHQGTIGWWAKQAVNSPSSSADAATNYFNSMKNMITGSPSGIPAPFLDSHDTDRIADGCFGGNERMIKFAQMLFAMYTGNTFTYYGDEIGAMGTRGEGSGSDANRRLGMLWCKDDLDNHPPISMSGGTPNYPFGGVVEQIQDPTSILNVVKKCNNARNAFPALMRGTPSRVAYSDSSVLVVRKTCQGASPITIVINFSNVPKTVSAATFSEKTYKWGVTASNAAISGSGSTATLPGYSIAIFG